MADRGTRRQGEKAASPRKPSPRRRYQVQNIAVERIRPEEGLGRKRDRDGHRELCRSIERFGVLTPITVRRAPDGSDEFLLIKGQGRTLACRLLGVEKIPALIVSDEYAEAEKVQQFLVENIARLRMRPVDRALLIAHASRDGEETTQVAERFGVSPATVRRLEAQLDGASSGEVAALRAGDVNLALHAVIARHVSPEERTDVINVVAPYGIHAKEMEALFSAIGWRSLFKLGPEHREQRLQLLQWVREQRASSLDSPRWALFDHRLVQLQRTEVHFLECRWSRSGQLLCGRVLGLRCHRASGRRSRAGRRLPRPGFGRRSLYASLGSAPLRGPCGDSQRPSRHPPERVALAPRNPP